MLTILRIFEEHRNTIRFMGGILIGLLIGLIFAYWIMPVKWQDATPGHLHPEFQAYYVNAIAKEYQDTPNIERAKHMLGLKLDDPKANPWTRDEKTLQNAFNLALERTESREDVVALANLARDIPVDLSPGEEPPTAEPVEPEAEEAEPRSKLGAVVTVVGILFIFLALAAIGFILVTKWRENKQKSAAPADGTSRAAAYGRGAAEKTVAVDAEGEPPLRSFTATYVIGDDFFNPSYSIERGSEFLGECGVDISQSIGAGDPKKVTALELWLFDKSDIKTVTKVLASRYAYDDPAIRAELDGKGDVLLIKPGQEIILETTALKVRGKVEAAEYAEGDLPSESFFKKVSIELSAWVK